MFFSKSMAAPEGKTDLQIPKSHSRSLSDHARTNYAGEIPIIRGMLERLSEDA